MKYHEDDISQEWNLQRVPGPWELDGEDVIIVTRKFSIEQQSEFGYMGALREPFADEVAGMMMAEMPDDEDVDAGAYVAWEEDMKHMRQIERRFSEWLAFPGDR